MTNVNMLATFFEIYKSFSSYADYWIDEWTSMGMEWDEIEKTINEIFNGDNDSLDMDLKELLNDAVAYINNNKLSKDFEDFKENYTDDYSELIEKIHEYEEKEMRKLLKRKRT